MGKGDGTAWTWKNEQERRALAAFCGNNDLVIGGSYSSIETLIRSRGPPRMQEIRGSLLDTRAMRGADANSDHHMVMRKVRLKLSSAKRKSKERIVFGTTKLRDPCVKEVFRLEVSNRFQALTTDDVD